MKNKRNSNIELLRIISMLMIVAGHFAGQGGLKDNAVGLPRGIMYILGSGQRVAINVFLIISVWFLIDQEFNAKRLVKIWLEVFFYTVVLTLLVWLCGGAVGFKDFVQAFLPFFGRPLWFASAYLSLLMLSPFLKKIVELPKKRHQCLTIILGLITCVLPTIASVEMDTYLCAIMWFCFVFIAVGYYKHYIHPIRINSKLCIIIGVLLYIGMSGFVSLSFEGGAFGSIQRIIERFLHDFKSIPNALIAFCICIGVVDMKPRQSTIVNELAAGSFAVYIIHQTPVFYPVLWRILSNTGLFLGIQMVPVFIVSVILIYTIFSAVDLFRRKVIESRVMKTKVIMKICNVIQNFYTV